MHKNTKRIFQNCCTFNNQILINRVTRGRVLPRFTRDLILQETFEIQILPNFKKLWKIMQRTLLDIDFMMLSEELTHSKFFRIR